MKHYYYWFDADTHRLLEFVCREIPERDMPCTAESVSSFGKRIWFFESNGRESHNSLKKIIKILR